MFRMCITCGQTFYWYQGQGHLSMSWSNIKITFFERWQFWEHKFFTDTSRYSLLVGRGDIVLALSIHLVSIHANFCQALSGALVLHLLMGFNIIWPRCSPSWVDVPFQSFVQISPRSISHFVSNVKIDINWSCFQNAVPLKCFHQKILLSVDFISAK